MLVADSGASHHLCNDRSSFLLLKKLSLPIVIKLGGNNSIPATHYGFIDIQGYQVEDLHTPTSWHSLPLITLLDLGRHMTDYISEWKFLHHIANFVQPRPETDQEHIYHQVQNCTTISNKRVREKVIQTQLTSMRTRTGVYNWAYNWALKSTYCGLHNVTQNHDYGTDDKLLWILPSGTL